MEKEKTVSIKDYSRQFAAKGGQARAEQLSREERKRIARKAARARWGKSKKFKKRR